MTLENISWLFVVLSLTGNYFVVKKHVLGQWLWAVANTGWVVFNVYIGAYSQAFLFTVYFGMSVWGILSWTKAAKLQKAT